MERRGGVVGYTDRETIKLDLDGTVYKRVKKIADYCVVAYHLEGYVILQSSKNNYHVVFDKNVSWEENVRIMAWVAYKFGKESYTRWFVLQVIKTASTLRIGNKGEKPRPRIVHKFGRQSEEIKNFREHREAFNAF